VTVLSCLPLEAVLVDDALQVVDFSRRCLTLFHISEGAEDPTESLTRALSAAAELGDELALATASLVEPGASQTFEWAFDKQLVDVSVAADDDDGRTFLVMFTDVTDARRVEHIQLEARSYLEQILADIPLGVVVLDARLSITFVNGSMLGIVGQLGGRAELIDVIGSGLETVVDTSVGSRWRDLCALARDEGKQADGEREQLKIDGGGDGDAAHLVLDVAAHPLHDRRGTSLGAILVLEDVTEKARLENEVIRMERLATVGQMVITVNHEINNPLTIIAANAQTARLLNRDLDEKTVAKLQTIEAQVKRISAVTERLRTMENVESDDYIADGPKMIDIHGKDHENR
jgi:nitrogen fixation/metabolism regulation signal transduction histidine kinase